MNLFDVIVILLVAAAILIGIGSGALPQLGGLFGAVAGGVLAVLALPSVEPVIATLDPWLRAVFVLAGILLIVGLGEAIGSALGRTVAVRLRGSPLGTIDRAMGGLVGAAQALVVVWLIGGLLAAGPLRYLATQAQTSFVVRGLNSVLPAPTEIAVELGQMLDDTGIPDLFVGLDPIPAPPVDRPTDPAADAIARVARRSTVRVSAATCEFTSSGSGFAIATHYIVTNAHVIAGASTIRVTGPDGAPYDATPVYEDPELDIGLLWVPKLRLAPLRFATTEPDRGAVGATLGFPHGEASLAVSAAAVSGSFSAQGLDIYGSRRVNRTIIELRASIEQGDSGGPLILEDGTVGGVVFAESRTDDTVGYALAPTAVSRAVAPAIGRTGRVDTGACIH